LNTIADQKQRRVEVKKELQEARLKAMQETGDECNLSMCGDEKEIMVPWRDPRMSREGPSFINDLCFQREANALSHHSKAESEEKDSVDAFKRALSSDSEKNASTADTSRNIGSNKTNSCEVTIKPTKCDLEEHKILKMDKEQCECKQWKSEQRIDCVVDHGWGEFHRDPAMFKDNLNISTFSQTADRPTKMPICDRKVCDVCYRYIDQPSPIDNMSNV